MVPQVSYYMAPQIKELSRDLSRSYYMVPQVEIIIWPLE